jgi:hypothetical protein
MKFAKYRRLNILFYFFMKKMKILIEFNKKYQFSVFIFQFFFNFTLSLGFSVKSYRRVIEIFKIPVIFLGKKLQGFRC